MANDNDLVEGKLKKLQSQVDTLSARIEAMGDFTEKTADQLRKENVRLREQCNALNYMFMTILHFSAENIPLDRRIHEAIRRAAKEDLSPDMQGFIELMLPQVGRRS